MNWKLTGVLVGIAVASTVAVKAIEMMGQRVDKGEVAKDIATEAVDSVKEQVKENKY